MYICDDISKCVGTTLFELDKGTKLKILELSK